MSQISELDHPDYYKSVSNLSLVESAQSLDRFRFPNRWKALDEEIIKRNIRRADGSFIRSDPNGPKGLGGFFLFFCVLLLINAVVMALRLFLGVRAAIANEVFHVPFFIYGTVTVIMIGYTTAATYRLMKLQKGAVAFAKKFLIYLAAAALIATVLGYYLPLADDSAMPYKKFISGLRSSFPITLVFSFLWYNYFEKSVRIANTFPETAQM